MEPNKGMTPPKAGFRGASRPIPVLGAKNDAGHIPLEEPMADELDQRLRAVERLTPPYRPEPIVHLIATTVSPPVDPQNPYIVLWAAG